MKKKLLMDINAIVKSVKPLTFHDHAITAISRSVSELGYSAALLSAPAEALTFVLEIFRSEHVVFDIVAASDATVNPYDMLITTTKGQPADFSGTVIVFDDSDWLSIYRELRGASRKISHQRNTKETQIAIDLNPDGQGNAEISTGLHFFDHMLEQVARHGGVDLRIIARGDLHIDEHHTIEDTAITLGEAFGKALGDKRGIERYGFCLPMDDALAQVAIDFGGRSWIEWDAEFKREKVGDVPTEMFYHFFKSFSDGAKCNLNIKVEGDNEHHKIEAIFKAFAKAIKMALRRDLDNMQLPSTKGVL
ncbi:MAG: histidinol-phosphatase [Bacteroidetes bacterium]|nr:histidinol-phosphatase [Bacteroidota bacterium]